MGYCFQKSLKRATALALIFAVSSPVSASDVRVQSQWNINEDDSFATIASRGMTLSIRSMFGLDMGDDINQQRTETISYARAVDEAQEDLQQVKRSVVASDLLSYPQSYDAHKEAFQNLIAQVYRNTPLAQCRGNPLEEISVKLFKVSQKHLSKSKERLEWVPDETLGAFFTFTNNKDQKVSILIKDLNAVLPLYMEHRRSSLDSLAPDGVELTADQLITGQFINRILSGEIPGNPLKRGIQFRLQNLTGLNLNELVNRFTGNNIPRPLVQPQNGNNQIVQVYHGNGQNNDYSRYFYSVLPDIGESFRIYNRSQMTDDEILACLFNVRSDQLPLKRDAVTKFRYLKEHGRPYASLFHFVQSPYEDYFEKFLSQMTQGFKIYNRADPSVQKFSANDVLLALFPNTHPGEFVSRKESIKALKQRAQNGRKYAEGFHPPYSKEWIDPSDRYLTEFENHMSTLVSGFNSYNPPGILIDTEVMSLLFTDIPEGVFPSRERALRDFGQRADAGRPYAKEFMKLGL